MYIINTKNLKMSICLLPFEEIKLFALQVITLATFFWYRYLFFLLLIFTKLANFNEI